MALWQQVLELDTDRRRVDGDEADLVAAIRDAALGAPHQEDGTAA